MRIVSILFILIYLTGIASAVTIHVPAEYLTIQQGINAAGEGDTVLIADGIYTGDGNKNLDFRGTNLVLMSENGPSTCKIDCQMDGRGFTFHNNETEASQVIGITVLNGYSDNGGGLLCEYASPVFKNVMIVECQAASAGGGVYVMGGAPQMIHCNIHNNYASTGGGLSINNSEFILNSSNVIANTSSG